MNMTRKRSPRKKRLEHGSYFTFDLWTSVVTVAATLMITNSCSVAISYQNTTLLITNKSSREQSVTEKPESRENFTNVTELFDTDRKQHSDTILNTKPNVTHTSDVLIFNITELTVSHDFVTSTLNMNDKRETALNGSIIGGYDFTTNSNDSIEPIINESINLNEDLRNVNNYTDESTQMTQNITKGIICFTNEKNIKGELSCAEENSDKDKETGSSVDKTSINMNNNVKKAIAFTEKSSLESRLENTTNKASNTDGTVAMKFGIQGQQNEGDSTIKALNESKLNGNIESHSQNILNNTDIDININNEPTILETGIKSQQSETRSGKRLGGRGNKKNYEIESRLQENNVIKDNSVKRNNNLLSNLSEPSSYYCNNCGDDNHRFNIKSDSFIVVGSKSDFNKKKVNKQVISDNQVNMKHNYSLNSEYGTVNVSVINPPYYVPVTNSNQEHDSNLMMKYTRNQSMSETSKDEGAFYAIRVLAQGVLESVAESIVPSRLLDLFRRLQNQTTTLETERLRSNRENGGIGNWGRSVIKSVIADPLNHLMQGVRDNGSLDSNRNFLSGVASGVAYVADSVSESFKDRVKAIYPGTLWCGDGDVARSDELGLFYLTDLCCKNHDTCKHYIRAGGTKFGLINTGIFSRSHCNCDKAFYRCLKKTNSIISTQIGVTFFSILGPQCFKKDYPIVRCVKRTRITGQKCEEYELDKTQPKIWQWFDSPTF